MTFSCLIFSPLVDLASAILLANIFNWSSAVAYVANGLVLAGLGGTLICCLKLENQAAPFVYQSPSAAVRTTAQSANATDRPTPPITSLKLGTGIGYVFIGVGIGAAIDNWIPETFLSALLGQDTGWPVLVATAVGEPMLQAACPLKEWTTAGPVR